MFKLLFVLTLVVVLAGLSCRYGSGKGEKTKTPEAFLNRTFARAELYAKDSISILNQLKEYLLEHKYSFSNKEYSDSTLIAIDTILYSPDLERIAAFIITKTPMSRRDSVFQLKQYTHWYDAYCYIGRKVPALKNGIELKWVRRFYPINWYNEKEISNVIREEYFSEFATIKGADGEYVYRYNFDDKRFWNCLIWEEYFGGAN